jgi:hypothetical protein
MIPLEYEEFLFNQVIYQNLKHFQFNSFIFQENLLETLRYTNKFSWQRNKNNYFAYFYSSNKISDFD